MFLLFFKNVVPTVSVGIRYYLLPLSTGIWASTGRFWALTVRFSWAWICFCVGSWWARRWRFTFVICFSHVKFVFSECWWWLPISSTVIIRQVPLWFYLYYEEPALNLATLVISDVYEEATLRYQKQFDFGHNLFTGNCWCWVQSGFDVQQRTRVTTEP